MITLTLLASTFSLLQQQAAFVDTTRFDASFPLVAFPLNHGPSTSGGGTSTISGETLAQGRWSFDWRTDYTDYDAASLAEGTAIVAGGEEHFDSLASSLASTFALSYGLTDNLEFSALTGWYQGKDFLDVHQHPAEPIESDTGDITGMMDLWLQAKYRVMRGTRGNLALLGGVKLPTGDDDERLDGGHSVEPSSQPGSGATDLQAGIGYSRFLTAATTLDASALITVRGEHDDFTVGDRLDLGVALAHRLSGGPASQTGWTVFGELLGVALAKDEEGSESNGSSGGTILYLSPGLRYRAGNGVSITLAPSIPVSQDWNGEQIETDMKVTLIVSFDW